MAGVVLDADHLTPKQRQMVANLARHAETVFVQQSTIAKYRLLFHTPTEAIDLCGHGTVAALSQLASERRLEQGVYEVEIASGELLRVQVGREQYSYEQLPPTLTGETVPIEEVTRVLDLLVRQVPLGGDPIIVATVSGTTRDLLMSVCSLSDLASIQPEPEAIASLTARRKLTGLHLFSEDVEHRPGVEARSRNFAPGVGILEDAATGTTTGALAAYLCHEGRFGSAIPPRDLLFEQGKADQGFSEIWVGLEGKDCRSLERVRVSGRARWENKKEFEI